MLNSRLSVNDDDDDDDRFDWQWKSWRGEECIE